MVDTDATREGVSQQEDAGAPQTEEAPRNVPKQQIDREAIYARLRQSRAEEAGLEITDAEPAAQDQPDEAGDPGGRARDEKGRFVAEGGEREGDGGADQETPGTSAGDVGERPGRDTAPGDTDVRDQPGGRPGDQADQRAQSQEPLIEVNIDGEIHKVPASSIQLPVKVDGQEQVIPGTQAIKEWQQSAASQRRFDAAVRMKREALQAAAQPPVQQPAPEVQKDEPKPSADPDATLRDEARAIAETIQYGDSQQVQEAVARLLQGREAPQQPATLPVDPEVIVNETVARVTAAQQWQQQVSEAASHYSDIMGSPELRQIGAGHMDTIRREELAQLADENGAPIFDVSRMTSQEVGQNHLQAQQYGVVTAEPNLIHEAGLRTRNWMKSMGMPIGPREQPKQGNGLDMAARTEAKRATAAPPRAASAKTVEKAEPAPISGRGGQDTINWIKASRGQPTFPPGT